MHFFDLFLIALICVVIIDISGFIEDIEIILAKWLKVKSVRIPKPFSCSFCLTHWIGLAYLLFCGALSLSSYAVLLLACVLTPVIGEAVWHFRDALGVWVNFIYLTITGYKNK